MSSAVPVIAHEPFLLTPPRSRRALVTWLRSNLHIDVPEAPRIEGHSTPLDYLCHAFFEDDPTASPRDCVIWANRGGGKTFYGAVATALDLIFKPGIEIKILGGSLEQSQRMLTHLRALFALPGLQDLCAGKITARRIALKNGSFADVLAQSHTSVRGSRPQKLRCDEVELFDREIWRAAQLVTRSRRCGTIEVRGCVEAISTCHRPFGLMSELIESCRTSSEHDPLPPRRLFQWSVIDVLEQCPPARPCRTCPLESSCAGRARTGTGHITIDDAITLQRRSDRAGWDSEMLCLRPRRTDNVYPEFDVERHVRPFEPRLDGGVRWLAGMDFGFRAPTVILWAFVDDADRLHIIDERFRQEVLLEHHIEALRTAPWPAPEWIGVDPAGEQRHEQTGRSNVQQLKSAGFTIRSRRSALEPGLRAVRRRLRPASGPPTLMIHPRCRRLVESLERYHFPPDRPEVAIPVKDGADHGADALRYLVVSLDHPFRTTRHDTL